MSQLGMFDPKGQVMTPKSAYKCEFDTVILFQWCAPDKAPFCVFPCSNFSKKEIPESWMQAVIDKTSRLKQLKPIASMEGKILSLYAKCETGK